MDAAQEAVEDGANQVEELKADLATTKDDIEQLTSEANDAAAALSEATVHRTDEKKKNKATIKEAQEAQEAVTAGIEIVSEFYGKAAEATAFVQTSHKALQGQPAIFDSPYKGMGGQEGGVLAMLEVRFETF